MTLSNKELLQVLESHKVDTELLVLKVDSMMLDMKQQSLLVDTLVMTLKSMSVLD